MARTLIPRQRFTGFPVLTGPPFTGVTPTTQIVDTANGMTCSNTGVEVLIVRCAAGESVNILLTSQPDAYGRLGHINENVANGERWYGPFKTPAFWGDGNANVYVDASGMSGSPTVKWVRLGA